MQLLLFDIAKICFSLGQFEHENVDMLLIPWEPSLCPLNYLSTIVMTQIINSFTLKRDWLS